VSGSFCSGGILIHHSLDPDVIPLVDVQQMLHANVAAADHKNAIRFHSKYPLISV
jgi:hypothetical protein